MPAPHWVCMSEYNGNTGRYPHDIVRHTNKYEVGISFIAYTSVAEQAIHCVLPAQSTLELACTRKYGPLRLAAHSWDPRQRSRDMQ